MRAFKGLLVSAVLAAGAMAAQPAAAATFVLANSNSGDGYVTGGVTPYPFVFDLFSANNGAGANNTTFSGVAAASGTWTIDYTYTAGNLGGAFWTPAGVILGSGVNAVTDQLSPASSASGAVNSGVLIFYVTAGEAITFYVDTYTSAFGRSDLAVDVASVPEPATWAFLILGFGGLGAMARKRRGATDPAFAAA